MRIFWQKTYERCPPFIKYCNWGTTKAIRISLYLNGFLEIQWKSVNWDRKEK